MPTHLAGAPLAPYAERTLNALFLHAVESWPELPALGRADSPERLRFAQVQERVFRLATALAARGVAAGDRVAILSENRPEWPIVDYAVLSLGAVTVPLYPTLPAGQVTDILADARPRLTFVSDAAQATKVRSAGGGGAGGDVVAFDDAGVADAISFFELLASAPAGDGAAWRTRARAVTADALATLIYTSGTTGTPKGVMLTHGNLAGMVAATAQHGSLVLRPGEVTLSILPLSHVFERAASYIFFGSGVTTVYAESMQTVPRDLAAVRPQHVIAVPRLFEKVYDAVAGAHGLKGVIARGAARTAVRYMDAVTAGAPPPALRARRALADRLVYRVLRQRVGGRLRTFICGGAPLEPHIGALFHAARMPIYEGYGLTETSPVIAANHPGHIRLGSAGVPYPGVEVRLGEQAEIQVRGPGVFAGYWQRPEATAAAFTPDGWLRTGDVGAIENGFLLVVDRLKELIVTAGGKNVAPQPLEQRVVSSPLISQAVLLGDRRPYLVMLVVPEFAALDAAGGEPTGVAAPGRAAAALAEGSAFMHRLAAEVAARLHDAARVERPKRIAILPEEFTVDNGLLTPTLKVRRRAVEGAYRELLDQLYAGRAGMAVPWQETP